MKRTLLTIAAATALTANLSAQITLNQSSYAANNLGTDTLRQTAPTSTFPNLTPATNASWDMTVLNEDTTNLSISRVPTTLLTAQFADSIAQGFGPVVYNLDVLTSVTSNGIIEYGAYVPYQSIPADGGLATVDVDSQVITYSTPQTIIQFPATINSSWTSSYQYDFDFHINVTGVYNNAPGIVRAFVTEKDSVTGWGQMRVLDLSGNPSGYINVLQVEANSRIVDSFFINGSIPPGDILTAFGQTEGDTSYGYTQNYYRTMAVNALATVYFNDPAYTQPYYATTDEKSLPEGIANINNSVAVNVYPNPVNNRTISVDVPTLQGNGWTYDLINVTGQTVATAPLNGTHTQIAVAPSLATGIYYLRVNQNGKSVCVKALDIN
jgi:hypothetical protein